MIRAIFISLALCATPALADLRPAPGYFLDAIVATSTAQQLARSCPTVSIDPVVVSNATGEVLERLASDGFDVNQSDMGMLDASADIKARQDAFVAKHDLQNGADTDAVCAAAQMEMAEDTQIGRYLVEVSQ